MKKHFAVCLLSLILLPMLLACQATGEYRTDVSVNTLAEGIHALWEGYQTDTSSLLGDYLNLDEGVREHTLLYRSDTNNLDEIGIFRLQGKKPNDLAAELQQKYLWETYDKNHTFYDSYMPNETPKLQNAEVRVYGNYVVYAILSEADKATLFRFVEETLHRS